MKREACAIVAACAAASAAADVVVFQNTNPDFDVLRETGFNGDVVFHGQYLDVTADAFNQPEDGTVLAHGITVFDIVATSSIMERFLQGAGSSAIVETENLFWYWYDSVTQFKTGDVIGPDEDWSFRAAIWVHSDPDGGTFYMTGEFFTAGILLELDGKTHYGFATLQRLNRPAFLIPRWRALQWGYETEPDTPLVLPTSCVGDYAQPYGALDFFDVSAFLDAYNAGAPIADLAEPYEVHNFVDLVTFLVAYNERCP